MSSMEIQRIPLSGLNLVEASAGTGKTYTLSGLYLRLLLEAELAPEQILVVTYTNAATAELKERIRKRLLEARRAFSQGQSEDPLLAHLLAVRGDPARAIRRLNLALAGFDRAAIHTIHGFCQRVLVENAFETSQPFEMELVPDQQERLQQIADDFWRRRIDDLPDSVTARLLERIGGPEGLLLRVVRALGKPYLEVRGVEWPQGLAPLETETHAAYRRLRQTWRESRDEIEALLADATLFNQTRYKAASVPLLCAEMDAWLEGERPPARSFEKLEKFTRNSIEKAVKKGRQAPLHPLFEQAASCQACFQMRERAHEQALKALVREFYDYLMRELPRRQQEAGEWSYDDLLLHLHDALVSATGGQLAGLLRKRFPAALVDEFQDTDPVQYRILSRIYAETDQALFLVGDPKQAIYSFRGADIFAYLQARQATGAHHSLDVNWRSTPGLIRALNTLYTENPRPFFFEEICYRPVKPCPQAGSEFQEPGCRTGPLRIWRLPFDAKSPLGDVRQAVVAATAGEIARLLQLSEMGRLSLEGRALDGGDIAVLVRTHVQARVVAQALGSLGVNSIRISQESVFHTREAEQLERLLLALAEPRREPLVRAALATDLLGWDAAGIDELNHNDRYQSDLLETFHGYHRQWRDEGFIRMFRQLLLQQGVEQRLLGYRDGERRLTNLYQLTELLQRQDRLTSAGQEALLKWLSRQRQEVRSSAEERLLRLESDSNLVKIVTLHACKGLEYPLVFCPFAWDEKVEVKGESFLFHDPQAGHRAVFELGSPDFESNKNFSLQEALAENLRLLYVALTRARYRVYLPWGRVKNSGGSALAWLLFGPGDTEEGGDIEQWTAYFKGLETQDLENRLECLVRNSAGAISVEPLPSGAEIAQLRLGLTPDPEPARIFKGRIMTGPRIGSFSSLIAGQAVDLPDHDALTLPSEGRKEPESLTIHGFPRGPEPGSCLHAIFEAHDFTARGRSDLERLVERNLIDYGLEVCWTPVVTEWVESVLATPLYPQGVQLGRVGNRQRINEMEFTYPIHRLDPRELAELARQYRFAASERIMSQFEQLHFASLQGFMKGYIDLVFEHKGRFYLVDYKSNWLGEDRSAYGQESLEAAMLLHHYPLQYLFYTLALHRYLRRRMTAYDYEHHFGGVFYLFLRGLDPKAGDGAGIFRERPPRPFVEALDRLMGGD